MRNQDSDIKISESWFYNCILYSQSYISNIGNFDEPLYNQIIDSIMANKFDENGK